MGILTSLKPNEDGIQTNGRFSQEEDGITLSTNYNTCNSSKSSFKRKVNTWDDSTGPNLRQAVIKCIKGNGK